MNVILDLRGIGIGLQAGHSLDTELPLAFLLWLIWYLFGQKCDVMLFVDKATAIAQYS